MSALDKNQGVDEMVEGGEVGSAFWYSKRCNVVDGNYFPREFVNAVAEADGLDLERLRLVFPQVVAAVWDTEGEREWITDMPYAAPQGFEPRYDDKAPTAEELEALRLHLGKLRNGGG